MRRVAALYIDPRGPYPRMTDVDPWDETRDPRLYDGPWPVVAHPPCAPWSRLAFCSGRDSIALADCALRAVEQVRAFGGVLEHPAHSRLFANCAMPFPGELPDAFGGVTIEVEQVRWGHVARKRTWLYLVGVRSVGADPPPRKPSHWTSGFKGAAGKRYTTRQAQRMAPPEIKICSAEQRRRTPPAFAEYLVGLARASRVQSREGAA